MKSFLVFVIIILNFILGLYLIVDLRYSNLEPLQEIKVQQEEDKFFWGNSDPNLDPYYDRDWEDNR